MTAKTKQRKRRLRRLLGLLIPLGAAAVFLFLQQAEPQDELQGNMLQSKAVFHLIEDEFPNADMFSNIDLYMGIDKAGNLALFDGPPEKKNPIETFFQLDIEHLETSLPHETVGQLYQGIRIRDRDEYNSVLSSLSTFIAEEEMLEVTSRKE